MPTKILARDWKKQILYGGNYLEIKGIHSFTVASQKKDADTTDFSNAGRDSHIVASRGTTITLEGFYMESSGPTSTKAHLETTLLGSNNDLKYEVVVGGSAANMVNVEYINPGGTGAISVSVVGSTVEVTLAVNSGVITSTAAQVKAAIEGASPPALGGGWNVTYPTGNTGTGIETAMAQTYLTGGSNGSGGAVPKCARDDGQARCEYLARQVSTTAEGTFRFITPGGTRWDFIATIDIEGPGGDTNAAASWKCVLTVTGAITIT